MESKYSKTAIIVLFFAGFLNAQEFKLAKTTGQLNIDLGNAIIQGYDGNEIVLSYSSEKSNVEGIAPVVRIEGIAMTSAKVNSDKNEERAKGLRIINSNGLQDNTGMGINVKDNGNTVDIQGVTKNNNKLVLIQVPKALSVKVTSDRKDGNRILFKDIVSEIETSVLYNNVRLENVTGPMTIKTTYGSVEGALSANVKSPISIISTYGVVDLSVPKSLKANVNLSAPYGDVFAAPEIEILVDKTDLNSLTKWTNDAIKGKINGGGIDLSIKCNYGKIYLRN
jgi:hypothetical protein